MEEIEMSKYLPVLMGKKKLENVMKNIERAKANNQLQKSMNLLKEASKSVNANAPLESLNEEELMKNLPPEQ